MSGLEALSLAANIMQIITFASDATQLCKSVYNNGRLDPQLGILAVSLEAVAKEAQAHQANLATKTNIDLRLEEMASKCQIAARELGEEVQYLHKGSKQGDLAAAVRVTVKVNWRKRRLDRLEATLAKFQTAMQTQLLYRVCKEQDAAIREQRLAVNDTNATVRQLVAAYASGQTSISLDIQKEAARIHDHVSSRTKNVEESLTAHIAQSSKNLERSIESLNEQSSRAVVEKLSRQLDNLTMEKALLDKRQRVLDSLRFTEMNGRFNAVEDAQSGTFEWIFDEKPSEQLEESEHIFDSSNDRDLSFSDGVLDAPTDSQPLARGGEDDHSDWEADSDFEAEDYSVEDERYYSAPIAVQGWDDIAEWLKSESQFYWICGHPGSGKSTLVKFLVMHSETQKTLHTWRPQGMVLQHFFWKPGTSMQNSVKGMLCTLAYRLLSNRPAALELCAQQPSLLTKTTCSDWSLKELRTLVLTLLKEYAPVCIFVDGLDEAPELDYCRSLLDLLLSMASLPDVKICAASRPEPVLKRRLESHPHLRLQDLTAKDLWTFTSAAFENERRTLDRRQRAELRSLMKVLVRRAEGVFLWLRLVVADILRDFASGYSLHELHERVERLPCMLTALYHDMWSRLNSDRSEDHRAGATILNLALVAKQFDTLDPDSSHVRWIPRLSFDLTLAEMLVMLDPKKMRSRPSAISFDENAMTQQLIATARDIRDKSASLLDIVPRSRDQTGRSGMNLIDAKVVFIHRSAYDFLIDTAEGQEIRSRDPSSIQSRYVKYFSAVMASIRTGERSSPDWFLFFLEALMKFFPPEIRQDWPDDRAVRDVLEELAALFLSGHFHASTESYCRALMGSQAALCISMAACPLYGWIRKFLSRLPPNLRARSATDVLRHIRYWWAKDVLLCESDLVEYHLLLLGDLLDLDASPYEYGPDCFDYMVYRADFGYYSVRCNAITEICMYTFEAWQPWDCEQMWTEKSGRLAPVIVKKTLNRIAKHGIVPEGRVTLVFVQMGCSPLILRTSERMDLRYQDEYKKGSYASGKPALSILHRLVMEVNPVYLIRAVASRAAYYERSRTGVSINVENNFGFRFAQDQPYAVLRYIEREAYTLEGSLGSTVYRISHGPCSQALQESITDIFHLRVRQRPGIDSRTWKASIALLKSDEAEQTSESIMATLAAEGVGFIHHDNWIREKEASARAQEEVS